MRSIEQIIKESRALLAAYRQKQKDTEKTITEIKMNGDLTKDAKSRLIAEAETALRRECDRHRERIKENTAEGLQLIKADNRHLDASRIDDSFFHFVSCLSDPSDFETLAKQNYMHPAKLLVLKSAAAQHGYDLNCGASKAEKISALENIGNILLDGLNDDSFIDIAINDTIDRTEKAFIPVTADTISISQHGDLESMIRQDLERSAASQKTTPEIDSAFYSGFGAETAPETDLTNLPCFDGVKAVTSELGNPAQEKRVLSALSDVLNSKQLSERIEPDTVKLTADFYRRNGDDQRADELQKVASLMLKSGFVFQNSYGTKIQPDTEQLHNRFEIGIKEREMKRIEAAQRAENERHGEKAEDN